MNVACFMSMNNINVLNEIFLLPLYIYLGICKCFYVQCILLFMFMGLIFPD